MSLPQQPQPTESNAPPRPRPDLVRSAIWVAIGALIAAAIVCVVWVLVGPENDLIGRAFLTILLLAGFAGVTILDAHLAPGRPQWFALTSMVVWIVILLDGAFLIWMPTRDMYGFDGITRFVSFVLIVGLLQLALLHVRLYLAAYRRYVTGFTTALVWITIALVAILAVMLVLALSFHEFIDFGDLYWRVVVAVTILAAVGTALIPLINALFAPKKQPRVATGGPVPAPGYPHPASAAPATWPTYADGATPLPVLPDGSPDWNAYYTGYPTHPAQAWQPAAAPVTPPASAGPPPSAPPVDSTPPTSAPAPSAPAAPPQPGYEGYPPPPPAPR